jgi:uncharacterized protein YoxC
MDVSITISDLLLFLLGAGGVVLIIFLIVLVSNLIKTLKSANTVLQDVEVISKVVAERTQDIDTVIEDVTASVGTITKNLKGNQGLVKTITSLIDTLTTFIGLFSKTSSGSDAKSDSDDSARTTGSSKKTK